MDHPNARGVPAADGGRLHLVVLPSLAATSAAASAPAGPGALFLHRLAPHAGREAFHVAAVLGKFQQWRLVDLEADLNPIRRIQSQMSSKLITNKESLY